MPPADLEPFGDWIRWSPGANRGAAHPPPSRRAQGTCLLAANTGSGRARCPNCCSAQKRRRLRAPMGSCTLLAKEHERWFTCEFFAPFCVGTCSANNGAACLHCGVLTLIICKWCWVMSAVCTFLFRFFLSKDIYLIHAGQKGKSGQLWL